MDFGTVLAIAAVNVGIMRWLKNDIWNLNALVREDQKLFRERTEKEMSQFREEMKVFHKEHAEMNKRILNLELERKHGCKTV